MIQRTCGFSFIIKVFSSSSLLKTQSALVEKHFKKSLSVECEAEEKEEDGEEEDGEGKDEEEEEEEEEDEEEEEGDIFTF